MVSRTTLADALIETGMEPEAAERAARMFEEWQGASAGQAEMDKRFDRVDGQLNHLDERLTGQDRVFGARLQTTERELQAVGQQVEALKDSTEREFKGVNLRFSDLRNEMTGRISDLRSEVTGRISDLRSEMNGRITDLKGSMEQRFKDLKESLEQSLALQKESLEQSLALQKESLEAKIESEAALLRSEIAAVRHGQRVMFWVIGVVIAVMLSGFGVLIGLVVELLSR